MGVAVECAPVLGDINNDGRLEIIFGCKNNKVYVLKVSSSGQTISWQGYSGDNKFYRTMNKNNIPDEYPPEVKVPENFTLSSNADFPDQDGSFNLTWTKSKGSTSYNIYAFNFSITKINGSLLKLGKNLKNSSYSISGLGNGKYFFIISAVNSAGATLSNCIEISVELIVELIVVVGGITTGVIGIAILIIYLIKKNFPFLSDILT